MRGDFVLLLLVIVVESAKHHQGVLVAHHAVPRAGGGPLLSLQLLPLVLLQVQAPQVSVVPELLLQVPD